MAILIISVLSVLLMSGVQSATASSRNAGCVSNLRALNLAVHTYAHDHNDCFPAGYGTETGTGTANSWGHWARDYIKSYPSYRIKEIGITFCPTTKTGGEGIYTRNATQWLTDYNVNRFVFSAIESNNRRSLMPGSRIMMFDGQGGVSGSATTSNQRLRHRERFNVVFVDGSVQSLPSFAGFDKRWQEN